MGGLATLGADQPVRADVQRPRRADHRAVMCEELLRLSVRDWAMTRCPRRGANAACIRANSRTARAWSRAFLPNIFAMDADADWLDEEGVDLTDATALADRPGDAGQRACTGVVVAEQERPRVLTARARSSSTQRATRTCWRARACPPSHGRQLLHLHWPRDRPRDTCQKAHATPATSDDAMAVG